ncbi:MAG: aspartate aminotransferase family protein, partial [Deltaproteobacteria bacterium]|nr:aspartate aminotransferase family protein [Deltaproteobacteria bacterium]
FFTNSGTEAVEAAILLAQMFTKSHELIALRHGYSGSSLLAMNITAHRNWRLTESLVPGIKHAHNAYLTTATTSFTDFTATTSFTIAL